MKNCDLLDSQGRCRKSQNHRKCEKCESNISWFDDELKACDVDEVCRRDSIFGNTYYKITEEQIEALRNGKVLYDIGEYGTFIILDRSENNESKDSI